MIAKLMIILLVCNTYSSIPVGYEYYRIIYIIHGDNNYLYHDEKGNAVKADEKILGQAKYVAKNIKRGEVFIFYHKPRNKFLFFTKDDGEFYYFKNGSKISEKSYSRENSMFYSIESAMINEHSEKINQAMKNILLYYGHEIPDDERNGYHLSYPDKKFSINVFGKGVEELVNSFPSKDKSFDLIILSTCRNGTETTLDILTPFTDYLIASPGDIHLSYLNSESLLTLTYDSNTVYDIALEFTHAAYDKLKNSTLTEVNLILYDLKNNTRGSARIIAQFHRPGEFGQRTE